MAYVSTCVFQCSSFTSFPHMHWRFRCPTAFLSYNPFTRCANTFLSHCKPLPKTQFRELKCCTKILRSKWGGGGTFNMLFLAPGLHTFSQSLDLTHKMFSFSILMSVSPGRTYIKLRRKKAISFSFTNRSKLSASLHTTYAYSRNRDLIILVGRS